MAKVAVLGSTGMLGSALTRVMEEQVDELVEFNRTGQSFTGNNNCVRLDVQRHFDLHELLGNSNFDYVVNAIGMIKQVIKEERVEDAEAAKTINSDFAERLNIFTELSGIKVIQIGTDCVYSGSKGQYTENDSFESGDIYSATKIAGEIVSPESMIIRTSIVGKEKYTTNSLLDWVLSRSIGETINGYSNHRWNGVTTLHFAEIVCGIIKNSNFKKGTFHLVPEDVIDKFRLIELIAQAFDRTDLNIIEFETPIPVDRSLATIFPEINLQLWREGGYNKAPSIEEMILKFAGWISKFTL